MSAEQPGGSAGRPAYLRIAADLRVLIARGELAPGAQVPAIAVLEDRYGVSSTVVRAAVRALHDEGLVRTYPGKGTFVEGRDAQLDVPADGMDVSRHLRLIYRRLADIDARLTQLEGR